MNIFKTCVVFVFVLLVMTGCAAADSTVDTAQNTASQNAPPNVQPADPLDEMAMGRKLYSANCAACHRDNGTGGKVTIDGKDLNPDDITSKKIKSFSDEKIGNYIKNGIEDEGMPAYKDKLTEDQIKQVVKYVRQELQKLPATPANPAAS